MLLPLRNTLCTIHNSKNNFGTAQDTRYQDTGDHNSPSSKMKTVFETKTKQNTQKEKVDKRESSNPQSVSQM